MKERGCPYRDRRNGRSISARPGGGVLAALLCSACRSTFSYPVRGDATTHAIDAKFRAHRWKLDPHICPDCQRAAAKKDAPMTIKESPAAMKAKFQMSALLGEHFDAEKGAYSTGWTDAKIASETGLPVHLVIEYRRNCLGEIKEPAELGSIRADIKALEALDAEHRAGMAEELAKLKSRVATVSRQFAA